MDGRASSLSRAQALRFSGRIVETERRADVQDDISDRGLGEREREEEVEDRDEVERFE